MKRTIAILSCCLALMSARAQTKPTAETIKTDSIILADIIDPVVKSTDEGEEPAWEDLVKTITGKYDATYADRTVTKAKIYYYYGKDYPVFATAIVHYTVQYEDKENFKLMNKNANYVLANSTDKKELETALGWVKHALDKEPANATYKKTVDDLNQKIAGIK